MTQCVLHIGFGKTGTSSLQGFLGKSPMLRTTVPHQYAVIEPSGAVLSGAELTAKAATSPYGYVSSFTNLWQIKDLEAAGRKLADLASTAVPVLSQEDWARNGRAMLQNDVLGKLGVRAHVVVYVRPQIEFFNSGWWQWWTWDPSFKTPSDVLDRWGVAFLQWEEMLKPWQEIKQIEKISVRLFRGDTIADFGQLIGMDVSEQGPRQKLNPSLAPIHIRVLKLAASLRMPEAPLVDELIQELFPSSEKTPWAMSPVHMQRVIDGCREANKRLMQMLDPDDAAAMEADQRWWSIEPFLNRPVFSEAEMAMSQEEFKPIFTKVLAALYDQRFRRK